MIDQILSEETTERAVLVGLISNQQNETKAKEYLDELSFLADTAGAVTVRTFLQKLEYPNPRTYVGKGKLDEIRAYIEDNDIGMAIFDDDLSSKQVVNIERELKVKILDRTSLILDIFAKRARTANAKTQGSMITLRTVVSSVANSLFSANTSLLLSTFMRVDLPALVYPTRATRVSLPRFLRCTAFCLSMARSSSFSKDILLRIMRRSVSICVSPGPRMPMPPR